MQNRRRILKKSPESQGYSNVHLSEPNVYMLTNRLKYIYIDNNVVLIPHRLKKHLNIFFNGGH